METLGSRLLDASYVSILRRGTMAITNRTATPHHKSHAAGSTDRLVIAGRVMVLGDPASFVWRETKY